MEKEIKEELMRFGLSDIQAKIYLYLVQYDAARIQDIVSVTGIPRSSVYDNVKLLVTLGLVTTIINHKFVLIKPVPIGVLKHSFHDKIQDMQESLIRLDKLQDSVSLFKHAPVNPATTIRYYKGIAGARQLFWNSLTAKNTVYVYSAYSRVQFLGKNFYTNFARQTKTHSIKEHVLINPTSRTLDFIKHHTGTSLSRTNIDDLRFLPKSKLVIQGETFLYDNVYAEVDLDAEEISGFEIESEHFTRMQRSVFETLWEIAKPIKEVLEKS